MSFHSNVLNSGQNSWVLKYQEFIEQRIIDSDYRLAFVLIKTADWRATDFKKFRSIYTQEQSSIRWQ